MHAETEDSERETPNNVPSHPEATTEMLTNKSKPLDDGTQLIEPLPTTTSTASAAKAALPALKDSPPNDKTTPEVQRDVRSGDDKSETLKEAIESYVDSGSIPTPLTMVTTQDDDNSNHQIDVSTDVVTSDASDFSTNKSTSGGANGNIESPTVQTKEQQQIQASDDDELDTDATEIGALKSTSTTNAATSVDTTTSSGHRNTSSETQDATTSDVAAAAAVPTTTTIHIADDDSQQKQNKKRTTTVQQPEETQTILATTNPTILPIKPSPPSPPLVTTTTTAITTQTQQEQQQPPLAVTDHILFAALIAGLLTTLISGLMKIYELQQQDTNW